MIYLNDMPIIQDHFPDNTLLLDISGSALGNSYTISWFYESDAELFSIICLKGWIDDNSPGAEVTLFVPYCPHARMDRTKRVYDVFSLKYFCQTINSLNFYRVAIVDPHSNVAPALLDRVRVFSSTSNINKAIDKSGAEVLFFPDEGASKRYSGLFSMPSTFGVKNRDWATGDIKSLVLMNPELVRGKRVLIVDDICCYGGTFARAAKALREAGAAAVDLYVTHCEPNIFKGSLYTQHPYPVDHIFTTDTLLEKPFDRMTFVNKYRPEEERNND